jgi:NAD(P)-dependent dehydrogenase (short-subunit alcohol dehydrogenase family)
MRDFDLYGKVALIIGESSGIGLAVTKELHSLGMHLLVNCPPRKKFLKKLPTS